MSVLKRFFTRLFLGLFLLLIGDNWYSQNSVQAATITVTTLADELNVPGQCSLRDAIQHANTDSKFYSNSSCPAGSGADTITFSVSGTITLTSGEISIISPITIQGPIILSGNEATRIFTIGNNGELTLLNLTVRDGRAATAGAIDANNGTLNLAGVSFINNAATGNDGGAIRAGRSLSILGSNFSANQAEQRGGAILFTGGASNTLLISATNFSGNQAKQRGGAIAAPSTSSILIADSIFSGNIAEGSQSTHGGGAVFIDNGYDDNEVVIERTAFNGNLTLRGSGGAIYLNDDIPASIRDSSFNGNASGGPLYEGRGGAIFSNNGKLDIRRVTFNGNLTATDGQGGAIHQAGTGATTAITNTSFFANAAPNGQGGALRVAAGQMQLRNVTLADNAANQGSALDNSGTLQVWNSILSGSVPVCTGISPQNQGGNLQHPGTSCGGGIASADPRLESPSFNGGALSSLLTMALRPDSPAIDAGNNTVCAAAPVNNEDQRGQPRPRDGNGDGSAICDIGAYETAARFAGYGSTPIQPGPVFIGSTTIGMPTSGSITIFETGNADLILSQPIISGEHAASFSLATSFPLTIPDGGSSAEVEIVCFSNGAGTRTATLSLLTNDPNRPEVVYNLLCEVTAAPVPSFASSPAIPGPVDFGSVYLGELGMANIALLNIGTADLNLWEVSLTGLNAADFSIDFVPQTIPFGHAPIDGTILCIPTTVGLRTAQLNFSTSDPSQPLVSFNLVCHGEPSPLQPLDTPGQSLLDAAGQPLSGATDVVVSPDGRHVYVTAFNSASISIFVRNQATGFLTTLPPLSSFALVGITDLAFAPEGQQIFATSAGGSGVPAAFHVMQRNNDSGALSIQASFRDGNELTNFTAPYGLVVSPDGRHIYVAAGGSNSIFIFSRNASGEVSYTATITSAGNLAEVAQLAISDDGTYLYATSHTLSNNGRIATYHRNPQSGLLSFKQSLIHNILQAWPGCPGITVLGMGGANGLTLSPDGRYLYVASWGSNAVARFQRNADGTLCYLSRTQDGIGDIVGLQGANDLTVTPDGQYLYVTAFERNPLNGALTQRQLVVPNAAGLPALVGAQQLALSPDGRSLHVTAFSNNAIVTLPSANPTPALESLLPASASAGGQSVNLAVRGSAFTPGAVIQVNSANRPTQYVTATELRTTLLAADLASAGALNVRVVNPQPGGGSSVNNLTFTITPPGQNPVPSIDYLNPKGTAAGEPGFILVINGMNFINGSQAQWNGSARETTFISTSEVRVSLPPSDLLSPGKAVVAVSNPGPGGGTSNTVAFAVAAPGENPPPTIIELLPSEIIVKGAQSKPIQVLINGQGLLPESQAKWNGVNRATTYVSHQQLYVTLTAADIAFEGYGAVTVTNPGPGGGNSNTAQITLYEELIYDLIYLPMLFKP